MCKKDKNGNNFCDCEWELIAWWKTMVNGDLVEYRKYQCKCCGDTKIE